MSGVTAQINDPNIYIKPSQKLKTYLSTIKVCDELPVGIQNIIFKNSAKTDKKIKKPEYLLTENDRIFLKSKCVGSKTDFFTKLPFNVTTAKNNDKLLSLSDIHWLHEYLQEENKNNKEKLYIHELLEDSDIILPKNKEIPRNPELELRCRRLKAELENKTYKQMTKNVDNSRRRLPEDTIGYQLKQLNKHLVAVFQFILSVAAGFAFGFIGVELLTGSLDFGFRLLLGIICALTIALAELYFLAKKLNEELQFEYYVEQQQKHVKVD